MVNMRHGFAGSASSACAAALLMAACASAPPPPKPTVVSGSIAASARVNPSVSQRPSPLLLRVYELKTANAFNAADFVSLYQRDQAELGTEVVAREEFTLAPGERRALNKTLAPETRFIAVFAAYRDIEHAKWRSVVAVTPGKQQQLLIQADELAVSAVVQP
ncbi:type VI secretion system lipoprotein TssJ [Ideonella azotifigens]|uniref:Type VI secretion system lipoprotein TssJ n=1 Tax=Ideonella azotifigens TaxID=513160 RepID=A0ABN1K4G7_9BURK|nr:type VI secretion system lipoprotein TssJ [Ideonella azotifigens]MCD2344337.1 type VI secretion system lipoprotein TssJ [Ideonella azotifigens]